MERGMAIWIHYVADDKWKKNATEKKKTNQLNIFFHYLFININACLQCNVKRLQKKKNWSVFDRMNIVSIELLEWLNSYMYVYDRSSKWIFNYRSSLGLFTYFFRSRWIINNLPEITLPWCFYRIKKKFEIGYFPNVRCTLTSIKKITNRHKVSNLFW